MCDVNAISYMEEINRWTTTTSYKAIDNSSFENLIYYGYVQKKINLVVITCLQKT
jgi:hypothetical protein